MFIKFFSIIFVITLFFGCQSSDSSSTNNDTTIENPSIIVEAVTMNIITVTSNPIQKNNRAIIIGTATNSKEKISFRINSRDYSAEPNDEGNWSITTEELTDSSYHIDFYNDGIVNGTLFQYNNSFIINSQNLIIDTTPPNATLPAIFTQAPITTVLTDTTPCFTGELSEYGTVDLSIDGIHYDVYPNYSSNNQWSISITNELSVGVHTMEIVVTDQAGNQSNESTQIFQIVSPRSLPIYTNTEVTLPQYTNPATSPPEIPTI